MMNRYMGAYLDRRMKYLIEEWQLATRNDVSDFTGRMNRLSDEIDRLTGVEATVSAKLASLEARAKRLEAKAR
ncbi:MAG: hypothetical protein LUQ25_07740 [Methanoregulaceae archaeon]|nr:hypothetical protein [Methanoregulaceae archaeon]